MRAKDIDRIAKGVVVHILNRGHYLHDAMVDVAQDEGIELTDHMAINTRVNEILAELRDSLN